MRTAVTFIIVIALAVFLLLIVAVFFLNVGGASMSTAQAQATFAQGCASMCKTGYVTSDEFDVETLTINHERFVTACRTLHPLNPDSRYSIACFNFCKNKCTIVTDPCKMACLFSKSLPGNPRENCENMINALPAPSASGATEKTLMGFIGTCSDIRNAAGGSTAACSVILKHSVC